MHTKLICPKGWADFPYRFREIPPTLSLKAACLYHAPNKLKNKDCRVEKE